MPLQGIIFDYGGTIDNNGDHWARHIHRAYATLPCPEIELQHFIDAYVFAERALARQRYIMPGDNFHDMMLIKARLELEELARLKAVDPTNVEAYAITIADYCYERARSCTEAAKPVLDYLATKYSLALVSNFYGNISSVLYDFGLLDYFPHIIESAVVGVRKPDPRIFALGVTALGTDAAQTLVVGDSISKDIVPALSLGCQAVWISGEPWFGEKCGQAPCTSIEKLEELTLLH